jgi:hypothetical protein
MYYDYIIVGLGPAGITTALNLAKTGAYILLLEADNDIGGCWKSKYIEQLYHSEHSPKVLFSNGNKEFKKLLKQINVKVDYANVYRSNMMVLISILYYVLNSFNINDYYNVSVYIFLFLIGYKNINNSSTIEKWCIDNKISQSAKQLFNLTTIAINGTNISKVKMYNLFKFLMSFETLLYYSSTVQMTEPNNWLLQCKKILNSYSNVTLQTNTTIESIQSSNSTVTSIKTTNNETLIGKNIVLCVPLRKMYNIVRNSSLPVQHNWFASIQDMEKYVCDSTYSGFGVQLHFDIEKKDPHLWCWSCTTEWNIIVVNKSLTLKEPSYDSTIKTVWGCVLCDFEARNIYGKTINDYTSTETVINEILRQLSNRYGENLKPKKITTHQNIYWYDDKWNIHESSFTNVHGALPWKGIINNLFTVGPHNMDEIVVIDSAIKSANLFCENQLHGWYENTF